MIVRCFMTLDRHLPSMLVVVASANNLFACGSKNECLYFVSPHAVFLSLEMMAYMFTLRRVAALDVAQRWVRLNNAC